MGCTHQRKRRYTWYEGMKRAHPRLCKMSAHTAASEPQMARTAALRDACHAEYITPVRPVNPRGTMWDETNVSPHAQAERDRRKAEADEAATLVAEAAEAQKKME